VNPWLGILLVLLGLSLLMGSVKAAQRFSGLHPEWSRKIVHVGMGFVTLAFPWLFHERWPVLLLSALAIASLAAVRWWSPAKAVGGGVLDGVARRSYGEFYFPLAVGTIFILSGGDRLRYSIPVLVLALADAVAALVGTYYGQLRYSTKDGHKSWEGSLAFFVVTFFAVHVPLLLFSQIGRAETLLIALILGLVVMLFEAIAWEGLDNLFIPFTTYFLLGIYLQMDSIALLQRLLVTLLLVSFVMLWRRRATLNDAALLGAALAGYGFFALGGWEWLLPPLMLFVGYTRLVPETKGRPPIHDIYAVLATAGPAILWLMLHRLHLSFGHYPAFCACYAAHLVIGSFTGLAESQAQRALKPLFIRAALFGWALVGGAYLTWALIQGYPPRRFGVETFAIGIGAFLGALIFAFWQRDLRACPVDGARWSRQAVAGIVASCIAYGITFFGVS
jgi:phytol kinase